MEKVRPWCGQPSDQRRLKKRTEHRKNTPVVDSVVAGVSDTMSTRLSLPCCLFLVCCCCSCLFPVLSSFPFFTLVSSFGTPADCCVHIIKTGVIKTRHMVTDTHPFSGLFSGTTQVSRYQKGKTNLDFTEARDREWQWHQLGHMQVCTSLQTDKHANTPPLSFYRPDALPAAQPTASKH